MSNPTLNQIKVEDTVYDIGTIYTSEYITDATINGLGQLIITVQVGIEDAESIDV